MDKATTRLLLDALHDTLIQDVLYTELVTEGRGFVDHNIHIIELESGDVWNEAIAASRVQLLEDTALIPPQFLRE